MIPNYYVYYIYKLPFKIFGSLYKGEGMTVLSIIGVLLVIFGIYIFIMQMNKFTSNIYRYEFFNKKSLILTTLGYICLYFGYQWYIKALGTGGDILNGQLLFIVGVLFVLYVVWENIKATGWIVGLVFSSIQLFLYIGISAVSIILVGGMIAGALAAMPYGRYGYYDDDCHY